MNKKQIATAFAVLATTTLSFSAFAASMDANARAYERAAAEQSQYQYAPVNSAPVPQASYVAMPPRPNYTPLPAVPYTAGDMSQQMPVSKELGDPVFVAPQTTAVGMQIMDPIPSPNAPLQQPVDVPATLTFSKSGSGYISSYRNNQLNAFDVLLNGRSYTFDLPAYTNGYQVKTASSYNRAGNGLANVFTTNVITEAIVNNTSLRVTVNMTQPTSVAASKLRAMQQSGQISVGEVSTLFAYNESYDGVKQAANYDVYNNNGRFIVVKSGAVTVPNGAQHPYATAMFAITDDTVAAVTVSGNSSETYELVKGTAYAIAASARSANDKVSRQSK